MCLLVCLTACRPSRRRARTGWAGYRGLEPEWKQSRAMASYDYVCGQCGVFEVVRAIDAPVCEQVCPACGGATASPTPPEHPVDHHPVIGPPPTPTRRAIRQQRLQPSPFLISQIMTIKHTDDLPEPRQKIHETRPSLTRPILTCATYVGHRSGLEPVIHRADHHRRRACPLARCPRRSRSVRVGVRCRRGLRFAFGRSCAVVQFAAPGLPGRAGSAGDDHLVACRPASSGPAWLRPPLSARFMGPTASRCRIGRPPGMA